ncbi:MAG: class I tRNA ligase family protein, partial [Candidatus Eremiobacteraeota bacterium]|nr:class I tRNA ligase family protein [Candidatus Eremiobacteraeota bacterium]
YGADVLRLWVASVDFTADMRVGETLLKSVGSVYRNLRNRLKMLLGLVEDFVPEQRLAREDLEPIDRLALAKLDDVARRVVDDYKAYRLHDVYLALIDYDTADLSSFYVDVLKDPLYSGARAGHRRKSAQTAIATILETLCVLFAPLLSFTAEEAWQYVPEPLKEGRESIFDVALPAGSLRGSSEEAEIELWESLKRLRSIVAASDGERDFALQARVFASPDVTTKLATLGDNLREALVVSALELNVDETMSGREPRIELRAADGRKCARCRKTLPLSGDPLHPTICAPCAAIVRSFDRAALL